MKPVSRLISGLLCLLLLAGCADNGTESAGRTPPPVQPSESIESTPEVIPPSTSAPAAEETEPEAAALDAVYDYETVEAPVDNSGQRIYGVLYRPVGAEGPRPAVIFSHGYGGSHNTGAPYAEELARRGMIVYCFDFRGGGSGSQSDGTPLEMTVFTEQSDVETVLTWLQAMEDVDSGRIFLMGTSQGGMVSAMTGVDHQDEIRGMVLLYPAFCIPEMARTRFPTEADIPDSTAFFSWMTVGRPYVEAVWDYDVYEDIAAYEDDVLIIHGDQDRTVDLSYSQRAIEVYPDAQLEVIPGAGHGFNGANFDLAMEYILGYLTANLNAR